MELDSLVVPQANAAEEAGKLLMDIPRLWSGANLEERRKLLLTILDAVYIDAKEEKSIMAVVELALSQRLLSDLGVAQN